MAKYSQEFKLKLVKEYENGNLAICLNESFFMRMEGEDVKNIEQQKV